MNGLLNACHLSVSESEDFDIEIHACKHMLTAALDTSSTDRAGISDNIRYLHFEVCTVHSAT